MGIEFKKTTGANTFETDYLGEVTKAVATRCSQLGEESEDSAEDYVDFLEITPNADKVERKVHEVVDSTRQSRDSPSFDEQKISGCQRMNPCDQNQNCVDTERGTKCECKAGYQEMFSGDCIDIDECDAGTDNCKQLNKKCVNTEGSFKCDSCLSGFEIPLSADYEEDSKELACDDVNECKFNVCQWKCRNLPGDFECICPPGYLSDGNVCTDIDECESNVCGQDKICSNFNGGHRCSEFLCPKGYKKLNST